MLAAFWAMKGGVGTTVVAAGAAIGAVHGTEGRLPRWMGGGPSGAATPPRARVLLVDLVGDQPVCLGLAEPSGPGVAEWLRADADAPTDALARMEVPVVPGLHLLPRGDGPLDPERAGLLVKVLAASGRTVVVDCGEPHRHELSRRFAAEADRSLVVARLCVIGLRSFCRAPVRPTGLVVVSEVGRSIRAADAASIVGAPVVADVAVDPAVARAVDAGLVASRLPRSFEAALGALVAGPVGGPVG